MNNSLLRKACLLAAPLVLAPLFAVAASEMMKPGMSDSPMMKESSTMMKDDGMMKKDGSMMAHDDMMMKPVGPGLQVGDKAPDFTLKNAKGESVSLRSLLAKGPATLVFYRSADWCPFCQAQMQDLQKNYDKIQAAGVNLVAICYDSPEVLTRVAAKYGLQFPLLSDQGSKTIDAFGIRNHEATGRAAGVPHPATFVVDRQGVIRAKLMEETYRTRPPVDTIIAASKSVM